MLMCQNEYLRSKGLKVYCNLLNKEKLRPRLDWKKLPCAHSTLRKDQRSSGYQAIGWVSFFFVSYVLPNTWMLDVFSICNQGKVDGTNDGIVFKKGENMVWWEPFIVVLTHYQTTNFRLFQTERVCRGQFQIWRKWQRVIQTGRKHCGKRRNCSLRAISPFPTVFSKGLFPRGVKRCHCVGMGLMNV